MNKFQIDARTQILISLIVGALAFGASSSGAMPGIPDAINSAIHAWALWALAFWNIVINPLLLAYTNSNPGPLAPPDSPAVKAAIAKENSK